MMKKLILVLFLSILLISPVFGGYVRGYFKSSGTYVQPHFRSNPNNTVKDNYSYKGNVNPYTGEIGTNKYKDNPTSDYYNPFSALFENITNTIATINNQGNIKHEWTNESGNKCFQIRGDREYWEYSSFYKGWVQRAY